MDRILLPVGLGMPGGAELFFILLLVLVFFGAKRLPELARSLGKGMSEFRKAMNQANRELENVTREVQDAASTEPTSKPSSSSQTKAVPPADPPPSDPQ